MLRVLKFGGTSISTPSRIRRSAKNIKALLASGDRVVVVVSASGSETNQLIRTVNEVSGQLTNPEEAFSFISMGEEKSVHLMTLALESLGVPAISFLPRNADTWPIYLERGDYTPLSELKINEDRPLDLSDRRCKENFKKFVEPLLEKGVVPVIAGFFALSKGGDLVTLGRGGSDITAFIVGRFLKADEVDIVTDVNGVQSADPKIAKDTRLIKTLNVEDLELLATSGSRVIHPRALKFKTNDTRARILSYGDLPNLIESGTTIRGFSKSKITKAASPYDMITILGENIVKNPGIVLEVSKSLKNNKIAVHSVVTTNRFICLFVSRDVSNKAYGILHGLVLNHRNGLSSVSRKEKIGEICIRNQEFLDTPGVLSEITRSLAQRRINIREVVTALTDIYVYVDWVNLDEAFNVLSQKIKRSQWSTVA